MTGGVGLFLSVRFGRKIDDQCRNLRTYLQLKARERKAAREGRFPDLTIASRLIAALRAGQSLDQAVEHLIRDQEIPRTQRARLQAVIERRTGNDFLGEFLSDAIDSGAPVLNALVSLHRVLLIEKKMTLRAIGLSAQCRAQAEVLTWIPWCLAAGIFAMEPAWFGVALESPVTWFFWSASLALCGGGRAWIRRLSRQALNPGSADARILEKDFPAVVLKLLTQLSLGRDPMSCLEQIQLSAPMPLKSWLAGTHESCPPPVKTFRTMVEFSQRNGAPLRDDLMNLLFDLHASQEARWEERLQQLPVRLLAPLFSCFFPACILNVLSLLLPILKETF